MSLTTFPGTAVCRNTSSSLSAAVLVMLGALHLSACAPPEAGQAAAPTAMPTASNPVAPAAPTKLVDTRVSGDASFDNYQSATITLDTPRYALHGNTLILKLKLPQGGVVFVGQIDKQHPFTLQTDLPLTADYVEFELVSDSTLDSLVTGRIAL